MIRQILFASQAASDSSLFVVAELERAVGHEKVIEAAYPIFMKAFGNQLDA